MEKPLYILVFLLLWSTRIKGGEEEDINVTVSPSAQKNEVRNSSIVDKASTSPITKTATIFDPDSESSETESPPIKSKAPQTNTDSTTANTTTLSDPDSDSSETQSPPIKPEAPQTTNESSETDSPPIKSKALETNTDSTTVNTTTLSDPNSAKTKTTTISDPNSESSNTESPPIKSEAPDTKNGTQQPIFRNFVTPEPAEASTAAKGKTATIGNPDSDNPEPSIINFETHGPSKESSEPDSPTIRSEAQETKTESSETDSASIKSEAPETEIDTQSPSIHNFESPDPAKASTTAKTKTTTIRDADSESSETDSPPNKSADSESNPDNPEPSIINFETLGPSKELSVTDSPLNKSEAQETRTDRELPPKHTRTSRATKENSKTNSPPNQRKAAKATERKGPQSTTHMNEDLTTSASTTAGTNSRSLGNLDSELSVTDSLPIRTEARETKTENPNEEFSTRQTRTSRATKATERKDPQSTTNMNEDLTTSVISTMEVTTIGSTQMTGETTTIGDVVNLTCSSNQSAYFKNQTNSSVTLTLSPFGNHSQLCILKWSESNVSHCILSNSSSDITIHGLDSGRPYNFSVHFLTDNKTHLSKSSCTVGPYYTRPKRPDCSQFNQTEPEITEITNTTITFGKNFISNNICANVTSMKNKSDWHLVLSKSIGGLSAATSYQILLFKYLNGSDGPILSAESCPLGTFHTLPNGPDCHVIPNKTSVTNRTSKSITLNTTRLKNLSEEKQLCVQIYSNSSKCKPVDLITIFDNLNSSSNYNFLVFSYYNVPENGPMVLSEIRCPLGNYYTLPASPNCEEIEKNVTVEHRTARSITLDFTKVAVDIRESLCVKPQYNVTCIHYSSPTMNFQQLNISESYNFSVHSYLDNPFLLSHDSCKISNYTGPDIPVCSPYIVSNRTTTSMLLDLRNLNTTGAERYIAEIFNDESESKEIRNFNKSNNYLENITNLTQGTAYTLRIFAVSKHNIRSADSCHLKPVYTYPSQPIKENYKVHSHSLQFSWKPPIGKVDSYNLTVHCNCSCCSCSKNYSHSVSKSVTTANVTELQPGTHCSVNITAISGGLSSIPLKYKNIETTEIAPGEVSDVMVTDIKYKGFTISWSKPFMPNGDLINYNVNLFPPARTINVPISSPSTSFNNSNPGVCYNVTVAAVNKIGEGKRIYRTVYTTETVPSNVTNLVTLNTSSTSIAVTWSKPHNPNGVIRGYQIFVRKTNEQEEGNNLKQIITLRCGSCQRPCPTALPQDNLQQSSPPYVNKGKDEKTTVHEVPFTESNTTLHYEVTGLEIFTSYTFNVTAFTSVGHGEWETNVRNTSEDIPSSVTDLTSSNTSSTSIAVTWSKPHNPNGVIREYQIFVRKTNDSESNNLKQIITLKCDCCQGPCPTAVSQDRLQESSPPYENKEKKDKETTFHEVSFAESNTTLHYEVTGLEIFTSYSFNVTAFTSAGHGEWATNVTNTSEDKPSPPGPLKSNVQVKSLSFVYGKPEKENGVITTQEIEYSYKPYNVCADDSEYEHTVTETKRDIIFVNDNKFYATLGNLQPFWRYTIRVRVSTYAGFSNYSQPTTIRTQPTKPGNVSNIIAAETYSRRIELKWTQPCHPNGFIINYQIDIMNMNYSSKDTRQTNSSITSLNVISLNPYSLYQFTVYTQVEHVTNLSEPATSEIFRTRTEAPYRPGKLTHKRPTATSVTLFWKTPDLKTGPTKYIATAIDNVTYSQTKSCEAQGFNNTSCVIEGLDSYWIYLLTVEAIVENFAPNKSTDYDGVRTAQSAPGKVSNFTVTQDSNVTVKTNVLIEWSPPSERNLNGIIKKYFLQYWYQSNQKMIISFHSTQREANIIVEAEKKYTFQMFAMTIENATSDDYVTEHLNIKPGAPLSPPKQKIQLINKGPPASDDQTQITVSFSQAALCNDSNGRIIQWYIIVSKTPGVEVFIGTRKDYLKEIENTYKKWEDVYEKDVNTPYIASDTWKPHCDSGSRRKRSAPRETISYTLGSDGDCKSGNRKYCNGNLEPGQTYRVRYAVCTAGGCLESEFSEPFQTAPNHVPAIAGSLTAVVLVLAVIIVVIIILKRRGKGPFKSLDNGEVGQQNEAFAGVEMKGTSKPKAVKIADFANYVQKLHADSNLLFSSEYKLLKETCPTHTTKAAEVQVNRIKNRYTNILSYDHSRVKLLPTEDDEGSDYINANYMPGYSSPREYIATQGPLPFTRDDFWRMIWEQNVSIIVMLTQLVERGRRKCDIYWPEAAREPVYYGDLVVELESESTLPDYVLRVMSIKLGDTRKTIKQFAYLAWPDMGIPETSEAMLKFAKEVRGHLPPPATSKGPMVVHCSAGVGRTGTFIAVDYLMQHVRTSDVIDIYSYVMKMRNNRPNMVQTEDQYVFIHDCIKDYVNKNDDDTDDEEEEEEKQEDQSIYMNV